MRNLALALATTLLTGALVGCGARATLDAYEPAPPATSSPAPDAGPPCQEAELASALDAPSAIVLDDTFVYWLEAGSGDGALLRCAKGGCAGAPTILASSLVSPRPCPS